MWGENNCTRRNLTSDRFPDKYQVGEESALAASLNTSYASAPQCGVCGCGLVLAPIGRYDPEDASWAELKGCVEPVQLGLLVQADATAVQGRVAGETDEF